MPQTGPNWSFTKKIFQKFFNQMCLILQANTRHLIVTFLSQNKLMLTGNLEIKYWKNYLYGLCKLFQSTELLCRYGIYVFEVTREKQYAHWDIILYYLSQNTISKYITTLSEMQCVDLNLLRVPKRFLQRSCSISNTA